MKLKQLPRYAEIASLLWKYGRGGMLAVDDELFDDEGVEKTSEAGAPEELASDLEDLGPTFVKLGQVLSTRADLLPRPYLEALARLQDDVGPFDYDEVETIVREELGVRLSKAFSKLEREPLAAASLGQVHCATLRDGRRVVVKVQRPKIRGQIVEDLEILAELAELLDGRSDDWRHFDLPKTVEDLRRSLLAELDYRQEAENLIRLSRSLEKYPRLHVPLPIPDYSTSKVLTMERIDGVKITDLNPVALIDVDGDGLVTELFRAYLDQVLVDGFFHADPHPGNLLLTRDHHIALLDLGMVARVPQRSREKLLRLMVAISDGQGKESARIALAVGEPLDDFDEDAFCQRVENLVEEQGEQSVKPAHVSELLLEVAGIAGEFGMRLPRELIMLGKTLLHLEEIGVRLAPKFDANAVIRSHAASMIDEQMRESSSPSALFSRLMEMKELVEEMPGRLNRLLTKLNDDGLRIDVDALDETLLIEGFQKVANRITSGLILAALIVGAAMLMQVPSELQILGYPALAIVLFLLAAAGGVRLLWTIMRDDRKSRR